jgi:hypothetical protein
MMMYERDRTNEYRAATFDARVNKARALKAAVADMDTIAADGFTEPTPSDVMMLHDPRVPSSLRWGLADARKRMNMMTPDQRADFRPELTHLDDGIAALVAQYGTQFKALGKFISPSSMPGGSLASRVVQNHQVSAKLAKRDGQMPHVSDLNYLVDPRVPASLRQRLIAAKRALDGASQSQRRAITKSIGSDLLSQVDGLRRIIGADGVAALRRVLSS